MTPDFVVQILRHALMTAFWLSAPLLGVGFVIGITMSLIQIVTSIQDPAFNAIPRLLAFLAAIILALPWMLQQMTTYSVSILETLAAMGNEPALNLSTLLGFLLTLARMAGVFVFIPLPGMKDLMNPVRVMLALGITLALFGQWPHPPETTSPGLLVLWLISEAGLGIGVGLSVAFATEAFSVGAQMMGLQAGYSFASTVDPQTQADSPVLVIFAQLASGMLFFAMGLDAQILQIFARSLQLQPPGSFVLSRGAVEAVLSSGSLMLSTGLRLALPITAVMVMVDISLALLGRVNSQLQLVSIAFPVKMMVGLTILGWLVLVMPNLLRGTFAETLGAAKTLIGH